MERQFLHNITVNQCLFCAKIVLLQLGKFRNVLIHISWNQHVTEFSSLYVRTQSHFACDALQVEQFGILLDVRLSKFFRKFY